MNRPCGRTRRAPLASTSDRQLPCCMPPPTCGERPQVRSESSVRWIVSVSSVYLSSLYPASVARGRGWSNLWTRLGTAYASPSACPRQKFPFSRRRRQPRRRHGRKAGKYLRFSIRTCKSPLLTGIMRILACALSRCKCTFGNLTGSKREPQWVGMTAPSVARSSGHGWALHLHFGRCLSLGLRCTRFRDRSSRFWD